MITVVHNGNMQNILDKSLDEKLQKALRRLLYSNSDKAFIGIEMLNGEISEISVIRTQANFNVLDLDAFMIRGEFNDEGGVEFGQALNRVKLILDECTVYGHGFSDALTLLYRRFAEAQILPPYCVPIDTFIVKGPAEGMPFCDVLKSMNIDIRFGYKSITSAIGMLAIASDQIDNDIAVPMVFSMAQSVGETN
jgi:hypothetical protein